MVGQELTIQRLHLQEPGRGAVDNPVAWKLGLRQALRQIPPQSAHLPPQAILVIRRLKSRSTVGLPAVELTRWRKAVAAQIDELAHQALRPGRQNVPPHANSVLFDDQVDLLLCYSRDLLAGRQAWYWVELFPTDAYPGQPAGQRLAIAWQKYPQAIPHTLVCLNEREATAVLNLLNNDQLSRLARCLHDTFALAANALDTPTLEPAPGMVDPSGSGDSPEPFSTPAAADHFSAPWGEWLEPARTRFLPPLAVYLLGLSHALVRRPAKARQPAFARQARRWLDQAAARPERAASAPAAPSLSARQARATAETAADRLPFGELETTIEGTAAAVGETDPPAIETSPWDAGTSTRLGGAILFVNVMIRLGLPEAIPELAELNPWELLGGLVAGLLGGRSDEFLDDPLWEAINELAGLEQGQPWGTSLPSSVDLRLPAAWLDQLALENAEAGVAEPWDNELSDLFNQRLAPNLTPWVRRLQPYLEHYLRELLPDLADPIGTLLVQPATMYLSRTHLDLLLSIEQVSLPLRRTGLDQSPGWRPAFGYIVTIHFE